MNVRDYRSCNQKWTIQKKTGNIGYIGTQDVEKQNSTLGKHAYVT